MEALAEYEWQGRQVLEIGIGQGADSEQLIRRGALWSGLDLTSAAVERMRVRAKLHQLPICELRVGSALDIPFSDNTFDIVFSHGVLHHIPDIHRAQAEIYRVLRPSGQLIMMVYAKHSLNYYLSIGALRRLGLLAAYVLRLPLPAGYEEHRQNAQTKGVLSYLRMKNFIHHSTDGPANPYSKAYTRRTIAADFPNFEVLHAKKHWMHAPPLPSSSLPGGRFLGWHLWACLRPKPAL